MWLREDFERNERIVVVRAGREDRHTEQKGGRIATERRKGGVQPVATGNESVPSF